MVLLDVLSHMCNVTSMQRNFYSSAIGRALKFKLVIADFKPVNSSRGFIKGAVSCDGMRSIFHT